MMDMAVEVVDLPTNIGQAEPKPHLVLLPPLLPVYTLNSLNEIHPVSESTQRTNTFPHRSEYFDPRRRDVLVDYANTPGEKDPLDLIRQYPEFTGHAAITALIKASTHEGTFNLARLALAAESGFSKHPDQPEWFTLDGPLGIRHVGRKGETVYRAASGITELVMIEERLREGRHDPLKHPTFHFQPPELRHTFRDVMTRQQARQVIVRQFYPYSV